ncbi:MAG: hypothetical protein KF819_25475 [Labilithrix sp.]|nr:hypothetical protein [Labilithrix sp.]
MTATQHSRTVASEESAFRGFARAGSSIDEAWLASLLVQRRARLGALFVKCFGRTLAARGPGLDATFMEAPGALDLERAWPAAIGQIRRALLASPRDPHRALVAATGLALHDAERGRAGRFEVTFERPVSFVFGGHVLPEAIAIAWESDGGHARARLVHRSTIDLVFTRDRRWRGLAEPLPFVATSRRDVAVLRSLPFSAPLPDGLVASTATASVRDRYAEAFALVARVSPAHAPWIERAVRSLLPVATPGGKTTSSSFEDLPGVVALSDASPIVMLADALVHEASHQHVFFLQQLGPVDDGSDEELYWSPARGEHRPIGKILLAYHAFVNVLGFWRACRDHGEVDPELSRRMVDAYARCCEELARPLETTRALTPIGRALAG